MRVQISLQLGNRINDQMNGAFEKLDEEEESPEIEAETSKVVKRLEDDPEKYWKIVGNSMADNYVKEFRKSLNYKKPDASKHAEKIAEDEEIRNQLEKVKEEAENLLENMN